MDGEEPERIANNYILDIKRYLQWYENEYAKLVEYINDVGLSCDVVFNKNTLDSDVVATEKVLHSIEHVLSPICKIFEQIKIIADLHKQLNNNKNILKFDKRVASDICKNVLEAMDSGDVSLYRNAYSVLEETYVKYDLQRKREKYFK